MATTEIGVRISLEGAQQAAQGMQQTAQGAERLGQSLGKLGPGSTQAANTLNLVGISAGQATNAMRQLPAQITDIVTGLASGQAPLTVLIQQGGQLRDSFGSVGNVLRALGSVITPATVALGTAAAALGALVYGIRGGQAEFDTFNRSLVLTGNAAGTTADRLSDVARAVGGTVGGQARAADALAQLAATGVQLGVGLDKAAEAAIRLERVGGPAIKDTVKAFADIAKDPLQASIRLNEQTNFLTVSLYRQIKALADSGKAAAAAAVASEAFANASNVRTKELEANLGVIERGWIGVKDAVTGALNAMLRFGRQDTLQQQLTSAEQRLQEIQASRTVGRNAGRRQSTFDADEAAVRQQIEALRESIKFQNQAATAAADRAKAVRSAIDADKGSAKQLQDQAEAAKKAAALLAELSGYSATYADDVAQLVKLRQSGALAESRYVEEVQKLVQRQPFALAQEREREKVQRELAKALEDGAKAQAKYLEGLDKEIATADDSLAKLRDELALLQGGQSAREALVQARLDDAAAQAAQNLQAAEARGVGEAEYERLSRLADKLAEVAGMRRQVAGATADKEFADANAKAAADAAREWDRTADSIRSALTDAFRRAFESGEDFGTAMAKVIGNELKARVATAVAGALADNLLALAGIAGGQQGGGNSSALGTVNNLATLYSAGAKGYGLLTGTAASGGTSAQFIAGYKGSSGMLGGAAGPVTDGAVGATGAGATAGNSAAWLSTWGAAIALGVYKANQDYSAGFRRDQAKDFSNSLGFGGYAFGGFESDMANALSKLGFSDRLADLLTGSTAVAALLGYSSPQIRNAGITGSITGGDFSGNATAQAVQQAGFVRKLFGGGDKVTDLTTALPEEIGRFLDAGAAGILEKAKSYGAALGLPVESLDSVSATISIKADEAGKLTQEALVAALGGYGDALVKGFADAVKPLANVGETTVQTIERVGGAIQSVNAVLGALGLSALSASVDGGKAALALQSLFGDVAGLQQAAGSYLQNYYTDAERAALTTQALAEEFGRFGAAVPATRAQFRDLVAAQDLTTASGQQAFAALMSVADAFAAVTPAARSAADILAERLGLERELLALQGNTTELRARERAELDESNRALYDQVKALEDQADALDAQREAAELAARAAEEAAQAAARMADQIKGIGAVLLQGVGSAYQNVRQAIDSERQRLTSQADADIRALEQQADRIRQTWQGVLDSLAGGIDSISAQLAGDGGQGAAVATLQQALADLRRGRDVDPDAIRAAAQRAAQVPGDRFATQLQLQRELASTANLLRDVSAAGRVEMRNDLRAIARQQVAVETRLKAQLDVLDEQLDEARDAAGTLVSIDDGIQSVAQAIEQLTQAVAAVNAANGVKGAVGQWLRSGGAEVFAARGGAVGARPVGGGLADTIIRGRNGEVFTGEAARAFVNDRIAAGDFSGLVARAIDVGIDSDTLDRLMGYDPGTAIEEARKRNLPEFAKGSAYVPRTGLALVHEGERIVPAPDNAQMMRALSGGGGDTVAELRALRAEVAALRAANTTENAAIASHAAKSARLLDDVTNGGASVATRAEA